MQHDVFMQSEDRRRAYGTRVPKNWTHGAELKRWRITHTELSQQDAATKVGVSLGAYGAWERGSAVPTLENLRRMVEELRVPPEVIGYDPPRGYELVHSSWLRGELATINDKLDRIIRRQERAR
jgi:transcriptional regulator with XRE-family HTH domain